VPALEIAVHLKERGKMIDSLVFMVTGDDQPGVVESMAEVAVSHDANWLESEITRVAGKVAGIIQVEVPKENANELIDAMQGLKSRGLNVAVDRRTGENPHHNERQIAIEVSGPDKPGIVLRISRILAKNRLNIDELHHQRLELTQGSRRTFRADIRVSMPMQLDSREVERALNLMADSLHLELAMHELPS
jgi:glycine cleavage system regulatory protein